MKKIKTNKTKNLLIIISIALLVVGITVAWFVSSTFYNETFSLSNFNTKVDCYFIKGSTRVETAKYLDNETGTIKFSLDSEDENYVGNFRVDVKYKGEGNGYLRTKVVTEFKSLGAVSSSNSKVPYIISEANDSEWYDNRNNDFCYYYTDKLQGNNNEYSVLNLISGIETVNEDSGFDIEVLKELNVEMSVAVEAEMVQINRYPQFWGIDELPWKNN